MIAGCCAVRGRPVDIKIHMHRHKSSISASTSIIVFSPLDKDKVLFCGGVKSLLLVGSPTNKKQYLRSQSYGRAAIARNSARSRAPIAWSVRAARGHSIRAAWDIVDRVATTTWRYHWIHHHRQRCLVHTLDPGHCHAWRSTRVCRDTNTG